MMAMDTGQPNRWRRTLRNEMANVPLKISFIFVPIEKVNGYTGNGIEKNYEKIVKSILRCSLIEVQTMKRASITNLCILIVCCKAGFTSLKLLLFFTQSHRLSTSIVQLIYTWKKKLHCLDKCHFIFNQLSLPINMFTDFCSMIHCRGRNPIAIKHSKFRKFSKFNSIVPIGDMLRTMFWFGHSVFHHW